MARHPRRPSGRGAPDRLPPPIEPPDPVVEIEPPDKSAVPTLRLDDLKEPQKVIETLKPQQVRDVLAWNLDDHPKTGHS